MSKRIRRPLAVLVLSMLLLVVAAGTALAVTKQCPGNGNPCYGTDQPDTLYDGFGTDYQIWAYRGADTVFAWRTRNGDVTSNEYDYVRLGRGNDYVDSWDGDTGAKGGYYDVVYGGPGYDTCVVDNEDYYYGCESVDVREWPPD
jgi:hypothetical protein